MAGLTLYDKLWQDHLVFDDAAGDALIYIDRHLVHEVTSPQAFEGLALSKRALWRKDAIVAVPDHNVPTRNQRAAIADPISRLQLETLAQNCATHGIRYYPLGDKRQGIVHVIGPEQGATLPGMTVVCGDSHTSTHGAFATLAMGIGTSDVEHVFATQCLKTAKLKNMRVNITGTLPLGINAKDLILAIIGRIGTAGGSGYAIEYSGDVIDALSMESRMTMCNMTIEAGARAGLIAFDDCTARYLKGRPFAPKGALWNQAYDSWQTLHSDNDAVFDAEHTIDASDVPPQVTWGTSPEMVVSVDDVVPDPNEQSNSDKAKNWQQALAYMDLQPGTPIQAIKLDKIFIGSCTNSRIEDLRLAAQVVNNKKLASNIKQAIVVPGSGLVKHQAEEEGLDAIFTDAGFEWREPGCSMCLGMNDDRLGRGERCASTSNRNFEGRQGQGGRTHLVSPAMAAAAAIKGHFTDIRLWDMG
ncbi:MAG: 3-isopropylmalate dehydratase large subunit [Gammaproteobacteria bacterium]|nr:3-isopropylmalate dehydratase large subunit [Gammaproteobacteria bacterium]